MDNSLMSDPVEKKNETVKLFNSLTRIRGLLQNQRQQLDQNHRSMQQELTKVREGTSEAEVSLAKQQHTMNCLKMKARNNTQLLTQRSEANQLLREASKKKLAHVVQQNKRQKTQISDYIYQLMNHMEESNGQILTDVELKEEKMNMEKMVKKSQDFLQSLEPINEVSNEDNISDANDTFTIK